MNIVFLSEVSAANVIGGAERVLSEQARGLRQHGHQISIVARTPEADAPLEASVGDIREYRYAPVRTGHAQFVRSSVRGSLEALRRARIKGEPALLLIHQALAGLGAVFAERHLPAVYVCHSLAHEEYLSRNPPGEGPAAGVRRRLQAWARRRIERAVLHRCRRVVVLSDFMRRRVTSVHGLSDSRVCLIPGGADPVQFHPAEDRAPVRRRLGLPAQGPVLVAVRNLVPRMGLERLIEAMALVRRWRADVQLILGGDGPLRSPLDAMIKEQGLEPHVQLRGFIPETELVRYYQAADLVVMPTVELEGFGLVTIEALACGTPVLGTPVGAIPEVLHQLGPDLVTEWTDAEALAGGIRRLLVRIESGAGARGDLSRACRRLVEDRYTWAHHLRTLDRVLCDTIMEQC